MDDRCRLIAVMCAFAARDICYATVFSVGADTTKRSCLFGYFRIKMTEDDHRRLVPRPSFPPLDQISSC